MTGTPAPRLVVAGLAGDAGKTLVTLAILLAARERGLEVRGFKKGPDYIDAAWIGWASGAPARNLDTYLMGPAEAVRSFARHAARERRGHAGAVNVIEGNRGVFDGLDAAGTHSTAVVANLLDAPVVLVLNARKVTATAAAPVRGCQAMDPALRIAGVILNQVAGRRHADVARQAIEHVCGVPVLGAIPRLDGPSVLPGRHLGLVPPTEHRSTARAAEALRAVAREHLDLDRLFAAAASAPPMEEGYATVKADGGVQGTRPGSVTIGYVSDSAFRFYYPENLEALESRGAALVPVSSIAGGPLPPDLDALYIGGGFPETHGPAIAANAAFLGSLRDRAGQGFPIFAECGGLMLLAASMAWRGARHAMAGVLPVDIEVLDAPQGHGYVVLSVDRPNAFFPVGLEIRAHEFHYSRIAGQLPATACAVLRGEGCGGGRDAIVARRVWAGYAHMHAAGVPAWADGMMRAAREDPGGGRQPIMSADDHRRWPHPIFLDLDGQPVVVIGGGAVAERKIDALIAASARITVVSPEVTPAIAAWAAEGKLSIAPRPYQEGDLAGVRLAYAATSDMAVNQAIRDEARAGGVWLNAVDRPALCDFISPATVRRGDLTLAVSTNGRAPALAKRIRQELEHAYGPEYAGQVDAMGEARDRAKAESTSSGPATGRAAGMVYLVGAGPGDLELITVKGRRLLEHADTVVYDALVDPRLLDVCRPSAVRTFVGKRSGCHSRAQEDINALLVEEARAGRVVVRLKGGDPFLFGRGGEEAEALAAAGIRFEVVPGVSAGTAVPAYAGIPLTHRGVAGEVVFLTGHDSAASPSTVDWARYASSKATLVVFMGHGGLAGIARLLIEHGRDGRCPVAVIAHGTTGAQRTVVAPLGAIADAVTAAELEPPVLVVVGDVVGLRKTLQWFEGGLA